METERVGFISVVDSLALDKTGILETLRPDSLSTPFLGLSIQLDSESSRTSTAFGSIYFHLGPRRTLKLQHASCMKLNHSFHQLMFDEFAVRLIELVFGFGLSLEPRAVFHDSFTEGNLRLPTSCFDLRNVGVAV